MNSINKFLVVSAIVAGVVSGSYAQAFNAVNAVSQASRAVSSNSDAASIKSGSKAYATTASIIWSESYNNGSSHLLKWGTSISALNSSVNLLPFNSNTDITTTITGLTASTKYYLQLYRVYNGVTSILSNTFRTAAAASAVLNPGHVTRVEHKNVSLEAYSLDGRLVSIRAANQGTDLVGIASAFKTAGEILPGSYIIVGKDNKTGATLFSTKQILSK